MAGGGTAGHLQPALAIAEALVDKGHDRSTIEFVGSRRGQDRSVLASRGFPYTLLPGRGIVRSARPRDVARNGIALAELGAACARGLGVVRRARPRVVVSVGGYASVPASLAAVVLGVPLVLVNVDAVPGAANRMFGRFARASAVGWDGTGLPRAVVTGTPVRPDITDFGRGPGEQERARLQLGLPPDRPTVAAFGGSLGARRINQAVSGLIDRWAERADRSIYHIVGRRDWEVGDDVDGREESRGLAAVQVPYQEHMGRVYAAADVVVCRAGAMTVAELAAAGVPSVLVPLPGAPGDHQTANARVLERAGASVLLPDADCDSGRLATTLDRLLADPVALAAMAGAATSLGRPDAAMAGALVVETSARPEPKSRR
jgi:undecaprenyldiphospho-muramoylpentapeptide beta-N-acetylglucosaminyltransferase